VSADAAPSPPVAAELAVAFAVCATSVGAAVRTVSATQLPDAVAAIAAECGARRAILDAAVHDGYPTLAARLAEHGVELLAPEAPPLTLAEAEIGVSLAAFGVAETGSVALAAGALGDRLAGMLPETHVVVLRVADLLPDLDAAGERLRAWTTATPPRPYVSLVTGPSRTADIERVLTIGVHGPRAFYVLLVADA
jgi:L-lactate dehydrogenase complex protein LldG